MYAWRRGPTHRLDKAKTYLSRSLDAIEDHKFFKDDDEVQQLMNEYDEICVIADGAKADYVNRPIYLKVAPKTLKDAKTVKKRAKNLHVRAQASSDQAKRRALLQRFGSSAIPHASIEAQETILPHAPNSASEVGTEREVTLAVSGAQPWDTSGAAQASSAFRITTTIAMLERYCPDAADYLYVPLESAAADLEPPIVYVSPSAFCNILSQIAAAAASECPIDEDYPMGDDSTTSP
ncbi:hypothetical protein OBBRIDRAFT_840178 [Obba rivulosa]|uniref:Uncharacterized protein n=1 Tax=Obba rivulosa TaxID=1052685 RepID=A0A8E2DFI3_9APHY|nr:hypothetical protein OBBRIDRAFT_840178 [Obba rivulosa]